MASQQPRTPRDPDAVVQVLGHVGRKAGVVAAAEKGAAAVHAHAQVWRHGPVDLGWYQKVLQGRGARPVDEQHPAVRAGQGRVASAERGAEGTASPGLLAQGAHRLCASASWRAGKSPRTRSPRPKWQSLACTGWAMHGAPAPLVSGQAQNAVQSQRAARRTERQAGQPAEACMGLGVPASSSRYSPPSFSPCCTSAPGTWRPGRRGSCGGRRRNRSPTTGTCLWGVKNAPQVSLRLAEKMLGTSHRCGPSHATHRRRVRASRVRTSAAGAAAAGRWGGLG